MEWMIYKSLLGNQHRCQDSRESLVSDNGDDDDCDYRWSDRRVSREVDVERSFRYSRSPSLRRGRRHLDDYDSSSDLSPSPPPYYRHSGNE